MRQLWKAKRREKKDVVEDEKEESKNTKEEEKLIKSDTNKDKEDTKDDEKVSTTKTEDIDAARPSEYCTKLCKKQRENDKYKPVLVHGNDFREAIQKWTKNHDDSPYGPILGCWDTSQVTDMSSAFMDSDDDDSAMNLNCWETKEMKPVKKKKKLFNAAGGRRGRDVDIDLSEV